MQKVKDEKVWKQVEDGVELNLCYRIKVNSRPFVIPILTASTFIMFDTIAVRIGIANALELTFIL